MSQPPPPPPPSSFGTPPPPPPYGRWPQPAQAWGGLPRDFPPSSEIRPRTSWYWIAAGVGLVCVLLGIVLIVRSAIEWVDKIDDSAPADAGAPAEAAVPAEALPAEAPASADTSAEAPADAAADAPADA